MAVTAGCLIYRHIVPLAFAIAALIVMTVVLALQRRARTTLGPPQFVAGHVSNAESSGHASRGSCSAPGSGGTSTRRNRSAAARCCAGQERRESTTSAGPDRIPHHEGAGPPTMTLGERPLSCGDEDHVSVGPLQLASVVRIPGNLLEASVE